MGQTPLQLLDTRAAAILLAIVWSGAALGITARMIWLGAPRWIYTPVYIALGWVAVGYMPTFWRLGFSDVVWLVALGGLYAALWRVQTGEHSAEGAR